MLLGSRQLVLSLAKLPLLTFSLSLSTFQGNFSALLIPFCLSQFVFQISYPFVGHIEGLHGRNAPPFFFFHLLVGEFTISLALNVASIACGKKKHSKKKKRSWLKDLPLRDPFLG